MTSGELGLDTDVDSDIDPEVNPDIDPALDPVTRCPMVVIHLLQNPCQKELWENTPG
jgi:hypothetical protein